MSAAMQAQIDQGYEYFLVHGRKDASTPASDIGYCAVQEQPERVMFLSKFYLHHARARLGNRAKMHGVH